MSQPLPAHDCPFSHTGGQVRPCERALVTRGTLARAGGGGDRNQQRRRLLCDAWTGVPWPMAIQPDAHFLVSDALSS
eukprot:scaffold19910_cov145-Isochrysis_galbana.AAC.5